MSGRNRHKWRNCLLKDQIWHRHVDPGRRSYAQKRHEIIFCRVVGTLFLFKLLSNISDINSAWKPLSYCRAHFAKILMLFEVAWSFTCGVLTPFKSKWVTERGALVTNLSYVGLGPAGSKLASMAPHAVRSGLLVVPSAFASSRAENGKMTPVFYVYWFTLFFCLAFFICGIHLLPFHRAVFGHEDFKVLKSMHADADSNAA